MPVCGRKVCWPGDFGVDGAIIEIIVTNRAQTISDTAKAIRHRISGRCPCRSRTSRWGSLAERAIRSTWLRTVWIPETVSGSVCFDSFRRGIASAHAIDLIVRFSFPRAFQGLGHTAVAAAGASVALGTVLFSPNATPPWYRHWAKTDDERYLACRSDPLPRRSSMLLVTLGCQNQRSRVSSQVDPGTGPRQLDGYAKLLQIWDMLPTRWLKDSSVTGQGRSELLSVMLRDLFTAIFKVRCRCTLPPGGCE